MPGRKARYSHAPKALFPTRRGDPCKNAQRGTHEAIPRHWNRRAGPANRLIGRAWLDS